MSIVNYENKSYLFLNLKSKSKIKPILIGESPPRIEKCCTSSIGYAL